MKPTPADIAAAKAAHPGTLHLLEYSGGAVIAKQPPRAEWDRLVSLSATDKANAGRHVEQFARACIVWPDADALDAIADERPALLSRFGGELADLAGASETIAAKKL